MTKPEPSELTLRGRPSLSSSSKKSSKNSSNGEPLGRARWGAVLGRSFQRLGGGDVDDGILETLGDVGDGVGAAGLARAWRERGAGEKQRDRGRQQRGSAENRAQPECRIVASKGRLPLACRSWSIPAILAEIVYGKADSMRIERQPRTSQITSTPIATAPAPTSRRVDSGVSAAASNSLRPSPGASAHNVPSMTRTSPSATTRLLIAPAARRVAPRARP